MSLNPRRFLDSPEGYRPRALEIAKKYEELARLDPFAYRSIVREYTWLGFGYLFGPLVLLTILLMYLCFIQTGRSSDYMVLILVTDVAICAVIRTLSVKVKRPKLVTLRAEEAPQLFDRVSQIAKKIGVRSPDQIFVDESFNVSATELPQWGFYGPKESYLTVGLPLLLNTTEEEALSLIARELGYFRSRSSPFGTRTCRLIRNWSEISLSLIHQGEVEFRPVLFVPFMTWFLPTFHIVGFALQRQVEYEVDARAAELFGRDVYVDALLRRFILRDKIRRVFWEQLENRIGVEPEPPTHIIVEMAKALSAEEGSSSAFEVLRSESQELTDLPDPQPSMFDRLRALGEEPDSFDLRIAQLPAVTNNAAEAFLGSSLGTATKRVDERAFESLRPRWRKAHAHPA